MELLVSVGNVGINGRGFDEPELLSNPCTRRIVVVHTRVGVDEGLEDCLVEAVVVAKCEISARDGGVMLDGVVPEVFKSDSTVSFAFEEGTYSLRSSRVKVSTASVAS